LSDQNTYAVMAQRKPGTKHKALDDFPTPPWATRALAQHVISPKGTCLEPACGRGHMSAALGEYFDDVTSSDVADYGYGAVEDFTRSAYSPDSFDWVITNPPFKLAEEFFLRGMKIARRGVAMLTRTVFIEGVGRYERLFNVDKGWRLAQFVERVPMVEGRLDRDATTATAYAWLVWEKQRDKCDLAWIPPCRKLLERQKDYDLPPRK
jgi:hypothetical protein